MPNKYRKGGVKSEHTIIPGIRNLLRNVAICPYVHSVTPGRISRRTSMGPSRAYLSFQYFQETGMKLQGKTSTAVQEVFVVTSRKEEAYEWLVAHNLITVEAEQDEPTVQGKRKGRQSKKRKSARSYPELTEASEMTMQRFLRQMNTGPRLSPLTEEQKAQLKQFKHRLENEERRRRAQNQGKVHPPQQERRVMESKRTRKGPTDMSQWLDEVDSMDKEQWDQLLKQFGRDQD